MPRPAKSQEQQDIINRAHQPDVGVKSKGTIKVAHLYAGLDLIGSKTSISNKHADMTEELHGIKMVSRGTNRTVVIPWSNIKGYELL